MADRTTPIGNTLLNADTTPNAGLPVAVTLLVPGNVAAQDATGQVIGTTPLPFVTNPAGTWAGAVIAPGDLTPAGCRYQVTEGSRVTISPSFAYTTTPIVVATWYAGPPSVGLILMYLTELEANALANPGATFSAAISQDAVWSGGAGIGQVIGAGAPPVQLQTNSSGTWQAYFPPSSQLNPSTTFYTITLDSGIILSFVVPAAYTGDQGAWLVGTTYAANAVVQVAGVPYRSLAGGNVGNAPASSPTFWAPYQGEAITGRLTTAIAAGQIAVGAGGIAHSASVPALIDDPTQVPTFLTDDLANLAGRTSFVRRAVSSAATAVATDDYLICDATGAAFAATLMASTARQRPIYVVRVNAGANAVTITPAGADTINGAATLVLTSQWQWAVLKSNGANGWYAQTGTGGSVTSVALTAPSYLTVAGSPITSGGTIALTMAVQNKNLVLASDPTTNGIAPIFRLLAASDMPASVAINPMTAAEDLIKGGTAGAPIRVGVGGNGQVLTVTAGVVGWAASASGFANPMTTKGDIIAALGGGTASRFPVGADGLTIVADSTQTLGIKWAAAAGGGNTTTKGDLQGYSTLAARIPVGVDAQVLTADSTQVLGLKWAASPSGFANPMTAIGDLIVGGTAGAATRTAVGVNGQVLVVVAGVPVWSTTNIAAGVASLLSDASLPLANISPRVSVYDPTTRAGSVLVRKARTAVQLGIIGDSIYTQNPSGSTVPQLVAANVATATGQTVAVTNQAISGTYSTQWTPGNVSGYFSAALAAFTTAGVTHCMIMLGTNDSTDTFATTPAAYQANMTAICAALAASGIVSSLNCPPYSVPGSGAHSTASLTLLIAYAAARATMANLHQTLLGDTAAYDYFKANQSQLSDGIHPTSAGQTALAGYVSAALVPILSGPLAELPIGTANQLLTAVAGQPAWVSPLRTFSIPLTIAGGATPTFVTTAANGLVACQFSY